MAAVVVGEAGATRSPSTSTPPSRDLNSTSTTDSVSSDVLLNVMEGLYRLDENTQPQPAIAESVEISDDQLNYVFTLRDGVKWSDGSEVTAQDFEYAWIRALDPDTAGQYAFIIGQFVEGGTEFNLGEGSREDVGIRATDDKTLEVQLALPAPFFLGLTSFYTYYPQKQSFVEEQGDDYAQSADALLYNGPYTLTTFSPTQGVTFVKNDKYWNAENVDIQKIEARIVTEVGTAVNLYESGQLDVQILSTAQYVEEFRDSPEFHTQIRFANYYLSFNYAEPIFQNENIRRAFQIGYDRDALVNQIINDGSVAATGFVPDGIAANGGDDQTFREVQGPVLPEFDAAEAKRLFQQGVEEVGDNPTIELLAYDTTQWQGHSHLPARPVREEPRGQDRRHSPALRPEARTGGRRRVPALVAGLDRGLQRPDDVPRPLPLRLRIQYRQVRERPLR